MKAILRKVDKSTLTYVFIATLVVLGFYALGPSRPALPAHASATCSSSVNAGTLSGYAWSNTIGWVSLNCQTGGAGGSNICGTSNYGVYVDQADGVSLCGNAWNDEIGWINFDNLTTGCNATYGQCKPYLKGTVTSAMQLYGWARACNAFSSQATCSGALNAQSGGWDGWIFLGGNNANANATCAGATCSFKGYGWGGETVGWLSYDCHSGGVGGADVCGSANYGVTVVTTPVTGALTGVPATVAMNGSITPGWASLGGVTNCTITRTPTTAGWPFTIPNPPASSGTSQATTITVSTTITLTCNGTQVDSDTVNITVSPPTGTFTAVPSRVTTGGATTLSWSGLGNVTNCRITSTPNAANFGTAGTYTITPATPPASGSIGTGALTATTVFGLRCDPQAGGTDQLIASVTVNVAPIPNVQEI